MSSSVMARPALLLRPRRSIVSLRLSTGGPQKVATKLGRRLESTTAATTKQAADAAKETTSKAASAVKETAAKTTSTASEYTSRASQGLSRVTSAAGPAISGAAQGVSKALGRVGGRTGRLIAFVEAQVPTVLYYSRVGLEVARIVFRGQHMAPPPASAFQSYFQRALNALRNPSSLAQSAQSAAQSAAASPNAVLNSVRNLSTAQLIAGGVVLAEVLGFFTVGEMIGRFKIVGYHGGSPEHH